MCSSDLPTVAVGANLVPLEQSTAADLDLRGTPCGLLLRRANAFRFTAPATGSYTVSTCASGANTRLAVLDGCGASAAPIACNDRSNGLPIGVRSFYPAAMVVTSSATASWL